MTTVYNDFIKCLPTKPYATDNLQFGLKIVSAEIAIKKRYLQPNKPTDLKWLVFDVDRPTAHFDWDDVHAPSPNFTVMNPENGHAHLYYGLEVPVYMQMGAKKNPIRYVSSIDVALTELLQADPQYSGLIAKNPFHSSWETTFWRKESYELSELADGLDLSQFSDTRKHLPAIGLGRNCNLFDSTRFFAYKEIRKPMDNYLFPEMYGMKDFIDRCISYAKYHNNFSIPLPIRECETIGKSVGSWVYQNMSPAGFLEWSQKRRERSIEVRHQISQDRRSEALLLRSKGLNPTDISRELGLSRMQIYRLLKV